MRINVRMREQEEEEREYVVIGGEQEGAGAIVAIMEDVNAFDLSKFRSANQNTVVCHKPCPSQHCLAKSVNTSYSTLKLNFAHSSWSILRSGPSSKMTGDPNYPSEIEEEEEAGKN